MYRKFLWYHKLLMTHDLGYAITNKNTLYVPICFYFWPVRIFMFFYISQLILCTVFNLATKIKILFAWELEPLLSCVINLSNRHVYLKPYWKPGFVKIRFTTTKIIPGFWLLPSTYSCTRPITFLYVLL